MNNNKLRIVLKMTLISLLVIFGSGWISETSSDGKYPPEVKVEYRPFPGSVAEYNLKIEVETETAPIKSKSKIEFILLDKIEDISKEGIVEKNIIFKDVNLNIMANQQTVQSPIFDRLKGTTLSLRISPQGKVLQTKGLGNFSSQLQGLNVPDFSIQLHPMFPSEELKINQQWTEEDERIFSLRNLVIRTKIKNNYRFLGVKEIKGFKCLEIETDLSFTSEIITVKKDSEGMLDVDMKSKGKGKIYYAYRHSRIISYESLLDIENLVALTTDIQKQKLPVKQKLKMNLELIDYKEPKIKKKPSK